MNFEGQNTSIRMPDAVVVDMRGESGTSALLGQT